MQCVPVVCQQISTTCISNGFQDKLYWKGQRKKFQEFNVFIFSSILIVFFFFKAFRIHLYELFIKTITCFILFKSKKGVQTQKFHTFARYTKFLFWIIFLCDCFLKGNFVIFYMLAKYVPGDIKYIFTKFYQHISTNNEANRKFVILISNFFMGCDVLAQ
jgi:hypothetical protein